MDTKGGYVCIEDIRMIKITKYKIKRKYNSICIHLYRLKFEIISWGNKRLYRVEWNDWNE